MFYDLQQYAFLTKPFMKHTPVLICTDSIYAIFYFSQTELLKVKTMLIETKTEKFIDDSIFLIDCRNDNKKSASIA